MSVERNIYAHQNGYMVICFNEYIGIYQSLEEARKARDNIRDSHEKRKKTACINGLSDRLNKAIWNSNKDNTQIAKEAKLSAGNLWKYRNGLTPSVPTLMRLATTLNVSTDWLLGLKG